MKLYTLLLTLLSFMSWSAIAQSEDEFTSLSKEVIDDFVQENFDKLYGQFDQKMREAISQEQLENYWTQITQQIGKFKEVTEVKQQQQQVDGVKYQTVDNTSDFEKGKLNIKITFNEKKQISGLYFLPIDQ